MVEAPDFVAPCRDAFAVGCSGPCARPVPAVAWRALGFVMGGSSLVVGRSELLLASLRCVPSVLLATGTTSRPWASVGACTRFSLAVESTPSLPSRLRLVALDQPGCRDVTAPELGCRADGGRDFAAVLLLLGSCHGPPMPPAGGGWRAPTRRSSVALAAFSPSLGVPGVLAALWTWRTCKLVMGSTCPRAVC